MNSENAIEVRDLKKSFKIYYDKGTQLKERVLFRKRNRYEKREVLKGISFDVKKGEAIGLIGHNGCGKSTTLKLLTRIIYPDSGSIEMRGRVSSLIELGAGFHPDMSGRENIYTNASIFGLSKKEIDRRIQDIIDFSEIEEFIDNPVRTYSSGMYMRLAFAVAINVDADILLIDEILAVGDASFQAKCFDKLREIKARGTTIVIVSHSLGQIEQICERSIWIHEGTIREEGHPFEVDMKYLDYMGQKKHQMEKIKKEEEEPNIDADTTEKVYEEEQERKIEITKVVLLNKANEEVSNVRVEDPVTLRVYYNRHELVENPILGLKIYRNDNVHVFGINSQNEGIDINLKDEGYVEIFFPHWNFVQGEYHLDVAFREENMTICDYQTKALTFTTYNQVFEAGIMHLGHRWIV